MIRVRTLSPDEWATWRALRLTALSDAPYAFGSTLADWQGEGDREERWRARLEIPGSYNVVAELNGRAVGMASGVSTADDGVVELISMWVGLDARGHGVGDRLIEAVEQWAGRSGAGVLRLSVRPGNRHALALYRRNGFTITGEPGDLMPDGVHREIVMAKPVVSPGGHHVP